MSESGDSLVFSGYTQEQLDAEYDNVHKIAGFDFESYLSRLESANQSARQKYADMFHQDIRYGNGDEEVLDLFLVNPGGPVHVFYHGGYWRMLHKNDFSYLAHGVLPHNINLAVVNYSLMPSVRMGALVDECANALHWLMKNASSINVDPHQISVSGHSAGGHLAAMMALRTFPYPLRSVCALSGIFDLAPIQKCFLNKVLSLEDIEVSRYSPVRYRPVYEGFLQLITGASEGPEYEAQARGLKSAWESDRLDVALELAPDHDHFSLREVLGDPYSEITRLTLGL